MKREFRCDEPGCTAEFIGHRKEAEDAGWLLERDQIPGVVKRHPASRSTDIVASWCPAHAKRELNRRLAAASERAGGMVKLF